MRANKWLLINLLVLSVHLPQMKTDKIYKRSECSILVNLLTYLDMVSHISFVKNCFWENVHDIRYWILQLHHTWYFVERYYLYHWMKFYTGRDSCMLHTLNLKRKQQFICSECISLPQVTRETNSFQALWWCSTRERPAHLLKVLFCMGRSTGLWVSQHWWVSSWYWLVTGLWCRLHGYFVNVNVHSLFCRSGNTSSSRILHFSSRCSVTIG